MKPIRCAAILAISLFISLLVLSVSCGQHPASCQVMKPQGRGWSIGSAGLISPELVVTNHHVAGGSGRVKVCWPNGLNLDATVIGSNPRADVAIVKLSKRLEKVNYFSVYNGFPANNAIGLQDGAPHGKRWITRKVKIIQGGTGMVKWYPHSIPGDSGGPIYGPNGTIYAICMGTNGYDSTGPSGYQICQLLRRLFPGCIRGGRFRPP